MKKGDTDSRRTKWIETGRGLLAESKIDLEASRNLSKYEDEGIKRRRLFLLQQSLEKCVKSILPELGLSLMSVPWLSSTHLFRAGTVPTTPLDILWKRGEPIFYTLERPKELTHNPAERLDIASFLEDCYLFALAVENTEYAAACLTGLRLIESQDLGKILSEIETEPGSLAEIESNVKGLGAIDIKNPKSLTKAQRETILSSVDASTIHSVKATCRQFALLALLSKNEQAARYPETKGVPQDLLNNLNRIQNVVQRYISESEEAYQRGLSSIELLTHMEELLARNGNKTESFKSHVRRRR